MSEMKRNTYIENNDDEQALQDGLTSAAEVTFQQIEGASHNTHWDSQAIASQVAGLIADFARE